MGASGFVAGIVLGALLLAAAPAQATPADDHRAGREAYVRGDVTGAIVRLRIAADAGHAPSQALLGEILDAAEQNEEAVRYFRLAAAQGDADGFHGLAVMHASGEGVPRDLAAAREWMTRAAEAGHVQSIHALALAYLNGGLGLAEGERTGASALAWIEKAAATDSLPAIDRLAVALRRGEMGLAPDLVRAQALEQKARTLRRIVPAKGAKKARGGG